MQVHFKIHGQGTKNLNGDGLAIWYTKERMQKGKEQKKAPRKKIIISSLIFSTTVFHRSCFWEYGQLHRPGRVCGHVSQRGETSGGTLRLHICEAKERTTYYQISEGRSKLCKKRFCNILKKVCLVLFCCCCSFMPSFCNRRRRNDTLLAHR